MRILLFILCLMPFSTSAEINRSALIEEILGKAVKPIQMDFVPQDGQLFALMYAQNSFTVLHRETREALIVDGSMPITMYDLLQTETELNPGSAATEMPANLAPFFSKAEFEKFGTAADRCLNRENCTIRKLSFNENTLTSDDVFNIVADAISDDEAIYESLTFLGTTIFDGAPLVRTFFFVKSANTIIGLAEPRDRVERSHGSANSIVYDVLIFETLR
jgi:hypothetical protein